MKITESRLRKLIRQVIKETYDNPPPPPVPYDPEDQEPYVGDIDDQYAGEPSTEDKASQEWSDDISRRAQQASY